MEHQDQHHGRHRWLTSRGLAKLGGLGALTLLVTGCGSHYVLFHPAGPVAQVELNMMVLAAVSMTVVIVAVFILLGVALVRYRDHKNRRAPYWPEWDGDHRLEILWFLIPVAIVTFIGIPTIQNTFKLASPPSHQKPLVIDVTSLTWKWLFEYPGQQVATVNYAVIPAGRPVLFELTADSAMNTFWVPRLGGMEYTMPNQVLPLWLEASTPGSFWGHSGNFSGKGFENMFFTVKAVSPQAFSQWVSSTRATSPPMTMTQYHQLLAFNVVGEKTFGQYPVDTFPFKPTGFTLTGDGMYTLMRPHRTKAMSSMP